MYIPVYDPQGFYLAHVDSPRPPQEVERFVGSHLDDGILHAGDMTVADRYSDEFSSSNGGAGGGEGGGNGLQLYTAEACDAIDTSDAEYEPSAAFALNHTVHKPPVPLFNAAHIGSSPLCRYRQGTSAAAHRRSSAAAASETHDADVAVLAAWHVQGQNGQPIEPALHSKTGKRCLKLLKSWRTNPGDLGKHAAALRKATVDNATVAAFLRVDDSDQGVSAAIATRERDDNSTQGAVAAMRSAASEDAEIAAVITAREREDNSEHGLLAASEDAEIAAAIAAADREQSVAQWADEWTDEPYDDSFPGMAAAIAASMLDGAAH